MQLARKITLPLAVSAFVALGLSAWLSVRDEVSVHHFELERDQRNAGRIFLAALERERAHGTGAQGAEALLAAANVDAQRSQYRLLSAAELPAELAPAQLEALARGEPVFALDVWSKAETWLPATLPDGTAGALSVAQALSAERTFVDRIITAHAFNAGTLAVLWAVVAIGLGAVLVGRPMRALAEKARRVARGDYSGPVAITQSDEIGELAREMNHMCDELVRLTQARAAAQDALRHADRLTTVGLLASGIAHELGTPLTVVATRAGMIASGEVAGEEALANARIVKDQAAQMTRIIRQLLDFARRSHVAPSRISLPAQAEQVVKLLAPLADQAGCALRVTEQEPLEAVMDPGQLQQVLINLVMNAVQATPRGGKVDIALKRARATPPADLGGREADYARIDVCDTGHGIPPEALPRLFEPFFTTKPVGDGTGLGLPVAWGLVREYRGWIAVASQPGAGSCFSLFLPLEPAS